MSNRKKKTNCSVKKPNETYHARHMYGGINYGIKECKKCVEKEMKNSSETNNEAFYGGRRGNFLASNIPISEYIHHLVIFIIHIIAVICILYQIVQIIKQIQITI